jgi:predicted methyltransferase
MTTPVQQKIRDKKRTPQQIIDMIKPGDWINEGSVGGDLITAIFDFLRMCQFWKN